MHHGDDFAIVGTRSEVKWISEQIGQHFIVKDRGTLGPRHWDTIASSCVCTSPLAVMTIVGLHDFVKVSISALLKSFLLIMCIDAPESTTNSRSSGCRVDAGKHLFSEGEKNVALSCSFKFNTLLASFHAASQHLALATLSPPETDPQILERWGYACAILHRVLRWVPHSDNGPERLEYEADPRHREVLSLQLGLARVRLRKSKSLRTPSENCKRAKQLSSAVL